MRRLRILDGLLDNFSLLVIRRSGLGCVDGSLDTNLLVVNGTRVVTVSVDGNSAYTTFLSVRGLVATAILALDLIDSAVRRTVLVVYLDVGLGECTGRSGSNVN